MALRIAVIAEAHADFRVISTLFDRVVMAAERTPDYIKADPDQLAAEREFSALEAGDDRGFTVRSQIKALHPGFGRGPGLVSRFGTGLGDDLRDTERCVQLTVLKMDHVDILILSRDTDGVTERLASWAAVSQSYSDLDFEIVLAGQHCKLEAWLLNGFCPNGGSEEAKLEACRQDLGFSPLSKAEQLSARSPGAKKDAKRVLSLLTNGDPSREEECYSQTALDILKTNGAETGLKTYLDEVEARCVPLFH